MSKFIYLTNLTKSIESFTSNKVSIDNDYFYYKNIDFRFAFERSIYFQIRGNKKILESLENLKMKESFFVKNITFREILSPLRPNLIDNFKVGYDLKYLVKKLIFSNVFFINNFLKIRNKQVITSNADYLFVLIHNKFIKYLLPIYKKIDNSVFIICGDIEKSIKICKENNYRYIVMHQNAKISKKLNLDIVDLAILYETTVEYISKINPKSIIIPEGNAPLYEVLNLATKSHTNIKTICIQHGWSPICHNGFRNMHYDLFISWGAAFSNALEPFNKAQKFIAIGSHILDIKINEIEKDSISLFHQGEDSIIRKEHNDEFFEFAIYLSKKYKKLKIIIREHPQEPLEPKVIRKLQQFENIEFMNPNDYLLSDVLSRSKIAVSFFSTVLFEAILYDTIPIIFNNINIHNPVLDLAEMNMALEVKSLNQAKVKVNEILKQGKDENKILINIQKNKTDFISDYGSNATNEIVKIILNESL